MKTLEKFFVAGLFLTITITATKASTFTVSNWALKPAQYSTLQSAVDAAVPGDTIIVAGSPTTYAGFTCNRSLTILGEGMNNPDGNSTVIDAVTLDNFNNTIGASNSKFIGIYFSYYYNNVTVNGDFSGRVGTENTIHDIFFERCQFSPGYNAIAFNYQRYSNFTFRNCLFTTGNDAIAFNSATCTNILFTNCVISSGYVYSNTNQNGNVVFRNCLFLNRTSNVFNASGLVVENCIFYRSLPQGASASVFNNNITYLNNNNALIYGDNVGSGNIIDADPMFVNYPMLGAAFAWVHNYDLKVGSPGLGTGTNGTNIGLSGGNSPYAQLPGNSRLPVVTQINIPVSSVPVGGTLQINVKAKTRK